MDWALLLEQMLNGAQFGVMLFLIASGLTLVLGLMNVLNLTHGVFYALGAYFSVAIYGLSQSFLLAVLGAIVCTGFAATAMNYLVVRHLYDRGHLTQLLATFGLLMFVSEVITMLWGDGALRLPRPAWLSGSLLLTEDLAYPIYRLLITAVGLAIAIGLHAANHHTRLGMLVRAGASDRVTLAALGVRVHHLYATVFVLGAVLAATAGVMVAPLVSIDIGMSDSALILSFVVITIGGAGSARGAFVAAILLGIADTLARTYLPLLLGFTLGPALSSMSVYVLMALLLLVKPEGLFSARW